MKVVLVFTVAVLAVALALPVEDNRVYQIVRSAFDVAPEGSYQYGFETENKIERDETGSLKTVRDEEGKELPVLVVQGSYSYLDPEGRQIVVRYTADENGFHPEGEHIPK